MLTRTDKYICIRSYSIVFNLIHSEYLHFSLLSKCRESAELLIRDSESGECPGLVPSPRVSEGYHTTTQ